LDGNFRGLTLLPCLPLLPVCLCLVCLPLLPPPLLPPPLLLLKPAAAPGATVCRKKKKKHKKEMGQDWVLGLVVAVVVLIFVSSTRTDLANMGHHGAQQEKAAASKED